MTGLLSHDNWVLPESSVLLPDRCKTPEQTEADEPLGHKLVGQANLVEDSSGEEDTVDSCQQTQHQQLVGRFPQDRGVG